MTVNLKIASWLEFATFAKLGLARGLALNFDSVELHNETFHATIHHSKKHLLDANYIKKIVKEMKAHFSPSFDLIISVNE